jgi:hypothetical protein
MNDPIQDETEMKDLNHENSFTAPKAETSAETSVSITDPDTMVTMIVLLLACLGLAVLAHAVV